MGNISSFAIRYSAAFWLIAGSFRGGELHGQSPAASGTSGNQSTGAAASRASASGGNANAGRGSGGSMAGSSAASTARNSAGGSTGYRTGNRGLSYAGGSGYAARGQWGYGGGNAGGGYGTDSAYGPAGGYGGAGQYGTAAYDTTDVGASFPGSVIPLPHWHEVGTTPLPTAFKANIDNIGTNLPAVSAPLAAPTAPLAPIVIPSNSGANAGGGPTGPITLGFEPVQTLPDQVGQAIAQRLGKLPSLHFHGGVRVDLVGRTAYLRGRVASEHERELAERVVLLEAGIDDVVNLIEVRGSSPALPPPPVPALPRPPAPAAPAANG